MDECVDRVGAGSCSSLLDDRPSGAVGSDCLAGDASVYTLTLKDRLGKAKDLLAEENAKCVPSDSCFCTETVFFYWCCALFTWQGTAGQDGPPGSPGEQVTLRLLDNLVHAVLK